jgi:hypothetical protein
MERTLEPLWIIPDRLYILCILLLFSTSFFFYFLIVLYVSNSSFLLYVFASSGELTRVKKPQKCQLCSPGFFSLFLFCFYMTSKGSRRGRGVDVCFSREEDESQRRGMLSSGRNPFPRECLWSGDPAVSEIFSFSPLPRSSTLNVDATLTSRRQQKVQEIAREKEHNTVHQ